MVINLIVQGINFDQVIAMNAESLPNKIFGWSLGQNQFH